jgi:hypothetical protein
LLKEELILKVRLSIAIAIRLKFYQLNKPYKFYYTGSPKRNHRKWINFTFEKIAKL